MFTKSDISAYLIIKKTIFINRIVRVVAVLFALICLVTSWAPLNIPPETIALIVFLAWLYSLSTTGSKYGLVGACDLIEKAINANATSLQLLSEVKENNSTKAEA